MLAKIQRQQRVIFGVYLAVSLTGCQPERASFPAPQSGSSLVAVRAGPVAPEHDFGTLLSHEQLLHYSFQLANPTDRAIRIVGTQALTPCCSSIGPLGMDRIPAHSTIEVPVALRVGRSAGPMRAEFMIRAEDEISEQAIWRLALRAEFVSEFEVVTEGDTALSVGRAGRQLLTLIYCRQGEVGMDAPQRVTATAPLTARLLDTLSPMFDESSRFEKRVQKVEVDLPASPNAGSYRGELCLRWDSGRAELVPIVWNVRPVLRLAPPGATVSRKAGTVQKRVVLTGIDRPIRILAVEGPLLAKPCAPSSEASKTHAIDLVIDPARELASVASDLVIRTDHPDQPNIFWSVLVVSGSGGPPE
jgi:hypothetical protein